MALFIYASATSPLRARIRPTPGIDINFIVSLNLVKHLESRLVSLAQNFDLKGIYVIDDTIVPLHAYEMAPQVIDVVLNEALAVSSDRPSMAPNLLRSATSHSRQACIDHLTPPYPLQPCSP